MDIEILNRLRKLEEAVEENRDILRKMNRARKLAFLGRIVYWVFIIALAFGAYYYVEPYVGQLMEVYSGARENVEKVTNAGESVFNLLP